MSKQDRQGARTLAELMSRYNFGKTFAEVMGFAESAQKSAEEAKGSASKLDQKLTQEEIFNRLTNNGQLQGLYRGDDGELYINASFLATGVISSADGTIKLDIGNNVVTIDGQIDDHGITRKTRMVFSVNGLVGYVEDDDFGDMREVLSLSLGGERKPTSLYNSYGSGGLLIGATEGPTSIGETTSPLSLIGSTIEFCSYLGALMSMSSDTLSILGKDVSWKSNGDGTFTMIGQ